MQQQMQIFQQTLQLVQVSCFRFFAFRIVQIILQFSLFLLQLQLSTIHAALNNNNNFGAGCRSSSLEQMSFNNDNDDGFGGGNIDNGPDDDNNNNSTNNYSNASTADFNKHQNNTNSTDNNNSTTAGLGRLTTSTTGVTLNQLCKANSSFDNFTKKYGGTELLIDSVRGKEPGSRISNAPNIAKNTKVFLFYFNKNNINNNIIDC